MADTRDIQINIILKQKTSGRGGGSDKIPKPDTPQVVDDTQDKNKNSAWQTVILSQAANSTFKLVKEAGMYSINRYFNLTEDYMNENDFKNATQAITKTLSFGGSIYMGAKLGAVGGPVGAFIGATISTATWLVSDGIAKAKKWQTARLTQSNANYESYFAQVRAGLVDGSRGTMN